MQLLSQKVENMVLPYGNVFKRFRQIGIKNKDPDQTEKSDLGLLIL